MSVLAAFDWSHPVLTNFLRGMGLALSLGAALCENSPAAERVAVWSLPAQATEASGRAGWTPLAGGAAASDGAALENKTLLVVARKGAPGVVLRIKNTPGGADALGTQRAELAFLAPGAERSAEISRVEALPSEAGGAKLLVTAGGADAVISLAAGARFVTVKPGKHAASLEVRCAARHALLPDFFADDTIYDPLKFPAEKIAVPAENFLLQLAGDGDSLVMCVWQGALTLPNAKPAADPQPIESSVVNAEPQVDLIFSGEGAARRIAASRIEFQGRPVHVGLLEHKGLWHDLDVSTLAGYQAAPIAWRRPFEARWRGDFILADGKSMADWPARQQSFDFKDTSDPANNKWWERGDESAPQVWQESISDFFVHPAFFKNGETRLCLYAEKDERRKADKAASEARKVRPDAPAVACPNLYERVVIYPLERTAATPLDSYTPVDLLRETLGQGPCEYVLDISGAQPRQAGGDRKLLASATCALWQEHIFPITRQFKKKTDGAYEPLDEKSKTHLIQALEDSWRFVHAIHDRLREYKKWGAEMESFCKQRSAAQPKLKPLADKVLEHVGKLNKDINAHDFEGPESEAYWKERVPELVKMAQADQYAEIATAGTIRNLGGIQDQRVSRCRQQVKAVRQLATLETNGDVESRQFATELRERCQMMLRHAHPKEGY
jgi:hypothetical protein